VRVGLFSPNHSIGLSWEFGRWSSIEKVAYSTTFTVRVLYKFTYLLIILKIIVRSIGL
jgi:hypothetical protein